MKRKVFPKGTNGQKSSCLSPSVILFYTFFSHFSPYTSSVSRFTSKALKICISPLGSTNKYLDLVFIFLHSPSQASINQSLFAEKINSASHGVQEVYTSNWQQCFCKILRRVLCLTMPVKSIWDKNIACQQIFLCNTKFCPERLFKKKKHFMYWFLMFVQLLNRLFNNYNGTDLIYCDCITTAQLWTNEAQLTLTDDLSPLTNMWHILMKICPWHSRSLSPKRSLTCSLCREALRCDWLSCLQQIRQGSDGSQRCHWGLLFSQSMLDMSLKLANIVTSPK